MGIVTIGLIMIAGACLFLGIARFFFWLSDRKRFDSLVFAIVCVSVSVYAFFEVGLAQATTPETYAYLIKWSHLWCAPALIGLAVFVKLVLHPRPWLFWTAVGLKLVDVVLNFVVFPSGISFWDVTSIGRVNFLGEVVSYPIGITNPWLLISHLAHLALVLMCFDASLRLWRKGEQWAAIVFGSTTMLFALTSLTAVVGVLWGFVAAPLLATPTILFIIAGMIGEMNIRMRQAFLVSEQLRSREDELRESIEQLHLSASAASVGFWRRDMETGQFWTSEKLKEVYGFSADEEMSVDALNDRIHPGDRDRVMAARRQAETTAGEYQIEYRIVLPDGSTRWIFTRGRADAEDVKPRMKRGAAVDITQRKSAENTVHELSGKLINAQEEERGRIARELHDDLSQRVALTSIMLEEVRGSDDTSRFVKSKLGDIIAQILTLATDMHKLSHELHPAKISQLGLEPALKGYCRDIQAAYPVTVNFEANGLPSHLPDDIALCFYRVAQESLQNVVRHSGANSAMVSIGVDDLGLQMTITDDGCGFDMGAVRKKDSLGLISIDERMRSVSGEARVRSIPGEGTTIEAKVLLNGKSMPA
ncbi:MAG TPA: PAS domain-containing protein [Pyrinomonadaceae bacterium]|nr:PAS domain-containing protein [Pyrinomonadaceae bacterium]